MRHPNSRAERRAVRDAYIARRKFIANHIWNVESFFRPPFEHEHWYYRDGGSWEPFQFGHYAKWNLRCGCWMCKIGEPRPARRAALDQAIEENLSAWE